VVSLREVGFYESGVAAMRESSRGAVDRLAAVLASRTEFLRIEGHTDDVPIHNKHFDSNWELSSGRATETYQSIRLSGIVFAPIRLSAAGYAEFSSCSPRMTRRKGRARKPACGTW